MSSTRDSMLALSSIIGGVSGSILILISATYSLSPFLLLHTTNRLNPMISMLLIRSSPVTGSRLTGMILRGGILAEREGVYSWTLATSKHRSGPVCTLVRQQDVVPLPFPPTKRGFIQSLELVNANATCHCILLAAL